MRDDIKVEASGYETRPILLVVTGKHGEETQKVMTDQEALDLAAALVRDAVGLEDGSALVKTIRELAN